MGAAQNFAQMVADIPILYATDFLSTFYRSESNGWKWDKNLLGKGIGIEIGPDNHRGSREKLAYIAVKNVVGGGRTKNETSRIKGNFLARHDIKNPNGEKEVQY